MKYSCLLCLPVIKVLITNKNPLPCLSGHVKSVHSQFFPKFEVATQALMPPSEPKLPLEAPFICPDCKEEFQSHESLKAHWQVSHKKRDDKKTNLLCNLCGKTLARNDSLTRHLWNEHKLGKFRMSCEESTIFLKNLAYIPHILTKSLGSSTCALTGFFWLLSHVIYLKLTRELQECYFPSFNF